jgi:ATP-dependent RNA helicase RhlE
MTFEELNLNKPLRSALDDLGYIHPTPIQQKAYAEIMSGKDLVAIAQTGTGKTFAYLLPILRQLKYSDQRHPRVLIVVPTRELVLQIVNEIEKLTTYMNVRFLAVYGGTNIKTQKQLVYNGVDIIVATPGRLADLALTGILRLKEIKQLVIDEVDQLFSLGFRQQLLIFLDTLPSKRQNLLFSATMSEEIEAVIEKYFYQPHKIEIAAHGTPLEKITQQFYNVPNFYTKVNLLESLLNNNSELSKVLVFVGTKKLANELFELMNVKQRNNVAVIHSNLAQTARINYLKQFHEGTKRLLIATDIVARGLDITDVTHVINFDFPAKPEDYIHRIGRTGRSNKAGSAISFVNDQEIEFKETVEALMKMSFTFDALPSDVQISSMLTDDETPQIVDRIYQKKEKEKSERGAAFHEKKEKNKKVNLGGPGRKEKLKGKDAKIRTYRRN